MTRSTQSMPDAEALGPRLRFAVEAATSVGDATLGLFGTMRDRAERKADGSEVTEADRAAETSLRERIAAAYPGDGVLGEEFGTIPSATRWRWIIDPIDGTFSFVRGVPLYATLLACEYLGEDGDPVDRGVHIGVIHMPGLAETVYAATGHGAWWRTGAMEPGRAAVSQIAGLAEAAVCCTAPDYFDMAGESSVFDRLRASQATMRGWPDAYAAVLLATGRCEAMVEADLKPWDSAPIQPIVLEAGGRLTDWSGRETIHSPTLIATNGHVHNDIVATVAGDDAS